MLIYEQKIFKINRAENEITRIEDNVQGIAKQGFEL